MSITADDLCERVDRLGITYVEVARRLGLTADGLYKQMHGARKVSRQTELLLDVLELFPDGHPTGTGRHPGTGRRARQTRMEREQEWQRMTRVEREQERQRRRNTRPQS
jgi:hypothetical protein